MSFEITLKPASFAAPPGPKLQIGVLSVADSLPLVSVVHASEEAFVPGPALDSRSPQVHDIVADVDRAQAGSPVRPARTCSGTRVGFPFGPIQTARTRAWTMTVSGSSSNTIS